MANKTLTPETILRRAESGELITAYQIAILVNEGLARAGSSIQIRPQMMYNFDKNGLIVKGEKNVVQSRGGYSISEASEFVTRYVEYRIQKAAKAAKKAPKTEIRVVEEFTRIETKDLVRF